MWNVWLIIFFQFSSVKDKFLFLERRLGTPANISTSFQRCFWVDMTSQHRTTSNQPWNNAVYVNIEIYNVEQGWINIVHFNVDLNDVRQRRNSVVIFNADFKPQFKNKIFLSFKEYAGLKILRGICKSRFAGQQNS